MIVPVPSHCLFFIFFEKQSVDNKPLLLRTFLAYVLLIVVYQKFSL